MAFHDCASQPLMLSQLMVCLRQSLNAVYALKSVAIKAVRGKTTPLLQMLSVSCRRSHVNEGSGCVVFFNMLDFVLLNCCHYWHILIAFCVKIPSVLTVAELHSLRKQSYLMFY